MAVDLDAVPGEGFDVRRPGHGHSPLEVATSAHVTCGLVRCTGPQGT